jgi:hypothetical protein
MAKKKGKGLDTRTVIIGVVVILIGLFVWAMVAQGPVGEDEEGLGQMAFRTAGSEEGGGLFAGFMAGGRCKGSGDKTVKCVKGKWTCNEGSCPSMGEDEKENRGDCAGNVKCKYTPSQCSAKDEKDKADIRSCIKLKNDDCTEKGKCVSKGLEDRRCINFDLKTCKGKYAELCIWKEICSWKTATCNKK